MLNSTGSIIKIVLVQGIQEPIFFITITYVRFFIADIYIFFKGWLAQQFFTYI